MTTAGHEFQITNFHPEEVVHYSIILLKGFIHKSSCLKESEHINVLQTNFKIRNGKFRVLYELSPGINSITLNYCCSKFYFSVDYAPLKLQNSVLPLYIICDGHDGSFQSLEGVQNSVENARHRITLCAKLLQCIIAEKMYEEGLPRRTFQLEETKIFHSSLSCNEARSMKQASLWEFLGKELINSAKNRKFLGFLSCTRYRGELYQENMTTHEELLLLTEAYVALGGGGLALFGSASFFSWPETIHQVLDKFGDTTVIDRKLLLDDSCYRGTFGACFSTTLGSVLHELGHFFDLGHTEEGIMGRGFDDISKIFTGCVEEIDSKPEGIAFDEELSSKEPKERKRFTLMKPKKENDGIFWGESCLTLLTYHRWLNDFKQEGTIKFDPFFKVVSSTRGIRVIELRRLEDGFVQKYWTFKQRLLKYSFQITPECNSSYDIVVEDSLGNILKETVRFE